MNFNKSKTGVLFTKFAFSIFVFIISIVTYGQTAGEPYQIIAILPFSYMVLHAFYGNQIRKDGLYKGGFIYKVALIVIFIRYVLTPLSIAITGEFYRSGINTSKESINLAVLLMVIELLCVYFTLFVARKYYSKRNLKPTIRNLKPFDHKFVLVLFILLTIPIVLAVSPNLLLPTNFLILNESYERVKLDMSFDGAFSTLAALIKPIVFLIILSFFKDNYSKNSNKLYIYLSFGLVIFFMGLYTGTQRWEIVFSGIIGIYLIRKLYNNIPKSLSLGVVLVMISSFISASLYKFSWAVQNSTDPLRDIFVEMFSMLQDYFAGPRVVANSIEMENIYGNNIGLSTFINDFIGSIPVISGFVNQSDRINVYFNMYHNIPGNNLITPMIGIGYSYFLLFPPLFTVICYWLLIKVDYKLETSKTIEYRYLYLYFGLYLSMSIGFNTQIIFAKFLIPFLMLLILFKVNDLICLKKKPYKRSIP